MTTSSRASWMRKLSRCCFAMLLIAGVASSIAAQDKSGAGDIPEHFLAPETGYDYTRQVVMVPMRDGIKLYTVILTPKGAQHAPILLTRTPYNAASRAGSQSPHLLDTLPRGDDVFVAAKYIRVFQDVRGKYGSEGAYFMTPPPLGPLNASGVDDSTDAYDTIDWLVKNLPQGNGRVGMIGSSYEGFTVVMALIHPHPALKAVAPESAMVDGWMGDDWFHYGAYRQVNFDYFTEQTSTRGEGPEVPRQGYDDYSNYLRIGSAGDFASYGGLSQLPFWRKIHEHPAYDGFWQGQALDKILARQPLNVPTLWVQGLWDQDDMWGTIHCYEAVEPKDTGNDKNFLAIGPWRHGQVNDDGGSLGPLRWNGDTALQFRRDVLLPFFNQYLLDDAPRAVTPPVLIYNTGENRWDRFPSWPAEHTSRPLYLLPKGNASFLAPGEASDKYDEFLADPAKPVPHRPRPVFNGDDEGWRTWLVKDQRFVDGRPDVLTYETEPLTEPLRLSGQPEVNLVASTSGSDSDWVVKLIDVFPDTVAAQPAMGGYELAIALDIFRGRYRESFEHPQPIAPDQPLLYRFALPVVNHVFEPGHRIMVQVQSSLFPLYDRNPQTFVTNIFDAKPADYQKAVQRVWHTPAMASFVSLPVVP